MQYNEILFLLSSNSRLIKIVKNVYGNPKKCLNDYIFIPANSERFFRFRGLEMHPFLTLLFLTLKFEKCMLNFYPHYLFFHNNYVHLFQAQDIL